MPRRPRGLTQACIRTRRPQIAIFQFFKFDLTSMLTPSVSTRNSSLSPSIIILYPQSLNPNGVHISGISIHHSYTIFHFSFFKNPEVLKILINQFSIFHFSLFQISRGFISHDLPQHCCGRRTVRESSCSLNRSTRAGLVPGEPSANRWPSSLAPHYRASQHS